MIDAPRGALPLHDYEVALGRGPFETNGERALFLLHGIQALVTRNSGGEATYAKIAVARDLALPVVMIERPPHRDGETAASVEEALAWIEARHSEPEKAPTFRADAAMPGLPQLCYLTPSHLLTSQGREV